MEIKNPVIFEYFEWYLEPGLWNKIINNKDN